MPGIGGITGTYGSCTSETVVPLLSIKSGMPQLRTPDFVTSLYTLVS